MLGAEQILALALVCSPQVEGKVAVAIARHESNGNEFAIGLGRAGKLSHQPQNREQAVYVASVLAAKGVEFDVGLMQIRTTTLRRLGASVEDALDPCKSLKFAQTVLLADYGRALKAGHPSGVQASLASLSAYNTGSLEKGFDNGYVAGVVRALPQSRRN